MKLFTVIFEYKNGTYVNQFYAVDALSACISFIKELDIKIVTGMAINIKEEMLNHLKDGDHEPVALKGLVNAWYTSSVVDEHLAEFNLILTQPIGN
jgi:hypothetical protein